MILLPILFILFSLHTSLVASDEVEPENKYIVVIDAGSTGSRIHVYPYQEASPLPKFMPADEFTLKRKPGLSSFKDKPKDAGASITEILDKAKEHIGGSDFSGIPVFLVATAGLRRVRAENAKAAEEILDSVRKTLGSSGFRFENEWAKIIEGTDEGLYGWVTVNYLLGNFADDATSTKGVLEMGGESVQLTYIPDPPIEHSSMLQEVSIAGKTHSVFTHSWMGYGMQAAQKKFDNFNEDEETSPCYLTGAVHESEDGQHKWDGSGNYDACYYSLKNIIRSAKTGCQKDSAFQCSLDGLPVPKLDKEELYLIENFWYTSNDMGLTKDPMFMKGPGYYEKIHKIGQKYCAQQLADAKAWLTTKSGKEPSQEEIDKQCFATSYINAMLKEGFNLASEPASSNYEVVRSVQGSDLDWALGYAIAQEASGAGKAGGKSKLIIAGVVVFLLLGGAIYWKKCRKTPSTAFPRYGRVPSKQNFRV